MRLGMARISWRRIEIRFTVSGHRGRWDGTTEPDSTAELQAPEMRPRTMSRRLA